MQTRLYTEEDSGRPCYCKTDPQQMAHAPTNAINKHELDESYARRTCTGICQRKAFLQAHRDHYAHSQSTNETDIIFHRTDKQYPWPTSFEDEALNSHLSSTSAARSPSLSSLLEGDRVLCKPSFESMARTKSLRKGPKAHRRAATIPAVLLSELEGAWVIEPADLQPIESEFEIRLRVYEKLDFESVPPHSARFRLRTMRDSLRGRVLAITCRLKSGI